MQPTPNKPHRFLPDHSFLKSFGKTRRAWDADLCLWMVASRHLVVNCQSCAEICFLDHA